MEKNCLIIDNEDQSDEIEGIVRKGKTKGIKINCYQFNVGSTFREDLLNENKEIDIALVVAKFKEEFHGIPFNLIAFDWNLSDDKTDGVELIRQFEHNLLRRTTPRLLYSGILKDQIASELHEFKEDPKREKQTVNWLNSLIKTHIIDFIDRPEYADAIVNYLAKSPDSIEFSIESELRKLKGFEFKSVFPEFSGKKFHEIADIIEEDIIKGSQFKKEMINQIISYLTQINLE